MLINKTKAAVRKLAEKCCLPRMGVASVVAFFAMSIAHTAHSIPAQAPLFQTNPVTPIMMLNLSRDHQLYFKVYDDYSDITNPTGGEKDGIPDTTYIPKYEYYGYFDSKKCYIYSADNKRFEPHDAADSDYYCTSGGNEWSGNFLNWASMTRIDAVRKILYGGYRSTDTASETVLERAFLPHDAHSFAKFYDGDDIDKLTPFNDVPKLQKGTEATGITICNTTADTDTATNMSQLLKSPPLLRVVKGNYSLWASNERWQCRFDGAPNDNDKGVSGINAYSAAPTAGSSDIKGEYVARVKVCVAGLEETDCKQYPAAGSAKKPVGLFQQFGETNRINFGLMTGSYGKNKSGGVLRKAIGNMSAEINVSTNGTFTGTAGAIKTLDALRIYGYNYGDGTYSAGTNHDNCPGGIAGFANGTCSNWGNPQSEIYLESLRYLAGSTATSAFASDDSGRIAGLNTIAWGTKPVTEANYCAPLNIIQFNASSSSFDDDELSGAGINLSDLNVWTNKIGNAAHENLSGDYFMGANASKKDGICTGKNYSALADVLGTCPDAPRLKGSYGIAGLSYFARQSDINTSITGDQNVRTFGVALAPAVPSIKIPVPGSDEAKIVEILPACKSNRKTTNVDGATSATAQREGNCAIVDFKIVDIDIDESNTVNTAKLYVNWESAEQGLDFDQDVWGTLDIEVDSGEARVTSRIFTVSTAASMGFGYVISGTDKDGWKVHSGIRDFMDEDEVTYCDAVDKCTCNATNVNGKCDGLAETPQARYSIGKDATDTDAQFLKSPLELAAKWGGYSVAFEASAKASAAKEKATFNNEYLTAKIKDRDISDSYFYATDPRTLKDSLETVMNDIAAGIGAASSVATVSARVSEGSFVYQAQFNSSDWTGSLLGYTFESDVLDDKPELCTSTIRDATGTGVLCEGSMQQSPEGRNIYFNKNNNLVSFSWSALTATQQAALKLASEGSDFTNAQKRADWITGSDTYEESKKTTASILRSRGEGDDRNILGDIVNSNPVYVGSRNFRYNNLPGDAGATYREFLSDKVGSETASGFAELVMVGANDGMVHAFNAKTMKEEFAFIPNGAFAKIAAITAPNYTLGASAHKYIVDGPLTYSDVFYKGEWRRIVVGTLGAGGRGVYALDVTDATPKLLFELSDADYPQMGYVLGKPIIAPMKNGRWTMIFGNGDSSESKSSLFVIDLEEPLSSSYSKVIDTGAGTGLSAPTLQVDSLGRALQVYAGDIDGNLWRFDLYDTDTNNSNDVSNWKLAYKLFEAKDGTKAQPITAAPTLGINVPKDYKTMVYFGTGKYYDDGDDAVGSVKHSFYAIADIGSTVSYSNLRKKTMKTTYSSTPKRELDKDQNPDWRTQDGWVLDFDDTSAQGERVTTKAILLFDKLIFPTLIPSNHACKYGGNSWLMEIPAVGDRYVGVNILKEMTYADYLILGNLNATLSGDIGNIIKNSSLGKIETEDLSLPAPIEGRQSWRQLQ
ncbi:pilus assembly protein [Cellvibrio sp. UBA7661]|uniref:pilus assembly protein n=1 Tax=Cellvibrio sp. UBA7661 TaxID=1946311 RepID=UPI002F3538F4